MGDKGDWRIKNKASFVIDWMILGFLIKATEGFVSRFDQKAVNTIEATFEEP